MTAVANRKADRELLIALADALSVSQGRLHRDPCGDWNLVGIRGHVLTDGTDAYVYVKVATRRRWESAKRTLGFMTVTQDGDDEGILKLQGTPTADQAAIIRKVLGLRLVTPLTDEQRCTIASRLNLARSKVGVSDGFIDLPGEPATDPASTPQTASTGR